MTQKEHLHDVIKIPGSQQKERILKSVRQIQQVTYEDKHQRVTSNFSAKILMAGVFEVFQILTDNSCQPALLYRVKLAFKISGEVKHFHNNN